MAGRARRPGKGDGLEEHDMAVFNAPYVGGPFVVVDEVGWRLWIGKTAPDD